MSKILVFGHQNPDTDAIGAAISFAYLQKELGKETEAVALGTPSEETQYALDYFNIEAPRVVTEAASETNQVMLVDHNEFQQSSDTIASATIKHVIDHHRIANFETAGPLCYRAEPVGCTATILYKMFRERGFEIKPEIAGLMLSAIISDSLLFKSPTCTQQDVKAAEELKDIAKVDIQKYGLDMLKAGASTTDKSVEFLLNMDAKSFTMGDYVTRIAQVNAVDLDEVLNRKEDLEKEMLAVSAQEKYDLFVLVVTDIINSDSKILVVGAEKDKVGEAFNVQLEDDMAFLSGVVSRKKQIVPQITEALTK